MNINTETIEGLNIEQAAIDAFKESYPNFDGELSALLALPLITYKQKLCIALEVVDNVIIQRFTLDSVESVIDIYEAAYPEAPAVPNAIQIARSYLAGSATLDDLALAKSDVVKVAMQSEGDADLIAWAVAQTIETISNPADTSAEAVKASKSATDLIVKAKDISQEQVNLNILISLV